MHDEKKFWDAYWKKRIAYYKKTGWLFENTFKWGFFCNINLFEHYLQLVRNIKSLSILEWGAGSGYVSALAAKAGAQVTITDFSEQSVEYIKIVCKMLGVDNRVKIIQGDLGDLPPKSTYDVVWNCGVIEHYSDEEIIFQVKSATKLVKPGGYIIFTLPNLISPEGIYRRTKSKLKGEKRSERSFDFEHSKKLFREAGLIDVKTEPVHYYVPSFVPGNIANFISTRFPVTKAIPRLAWLYSVVGKVR